jgi:hypothetical protein
MEETKETKNLKIDSLENLLPLFNKIIKGANVFRNIPDAERNDQFKNFLVAYFNNLPISEIRTLAVDLHNVHGLIGLLSKFMQVYYATRFLEEIK